MKKLMYFFAILFSLVVIGCGDDSKGEGNVASISSEKVIQSYLDQQIYFKNEAINELKVHINPQSNRFHFDALAETSTEALRDSIRNSLYIMTSVLTVSEIDALSDMLAPLQEMITYKISSEKFGEVPQVVTIRGGKNVQKITIVLKVPDVEEINRMVTENIEKELIQYQSNRLFHGDSTRVKLKINNLKEIPESLVQTPNFSSETLQQYQKYVNDIKNSDKERKKVADIILSSFSKILKNKEFPCKEQTLTLYVQLNKKEKELLFFPIINENDLLSNIEAFNFVSEYCLWKPFMKATFGEYGFSKVPSPKKSLLGYMYTNINIPDYGKVPGIQIDGCKVSVIDIKKDVIEDEKFDFYSNKVFKIPRNALSVTYYIENDSNKPTSSSSFELRDRHNRNISDSDESVTIPPGHNLKFVKKYWLNSEESAKYNLNGMESYQLTVFDIKLPLQDKIYEELKATHNNPLPKTLSAIETLESFYKNISNRNFLKAYEYLDSKMKEQFSFDSWESGFRNTVSSTPSDIKIVSESETQTILTYTLTVINDSVETRKFIGTATFIKTNEGWKIDDVKNQIQ